MFDDVIAQFYDYILVSFASSILLINHFIKEPDLS